MPNKKTFKEVTKDYEEVKNNPDNPFNIDLSNVDTLANSTKKLNILAKVLIFSLALNIVLALGYFFLFPLKKVEYITVGYKVEDDGITSVKVMPSKDLAKNTGQLKLLIKYFVEDTIIKALSNYRNDKLLRQDLSIVSTRVTPSVLQEVARLQKLFEKKANIQTRQIIIDESESGSQFGVWKLGFITVDTDNNGNVFKNKFNAKVTYAIHGFNSSPEMNIPVDLLKENSNPLGLKVTGFYRLKEES